MRLTLETVVQHMFHASLVYPDHVVRERVASLVVLWFPEFTMCAVHLKLVLASAQIKCRADSLECTLGSEIHLDVPETVVTALGLDTPGTLAAIKEQWERAARPKDRTPAMVDAERVAWYVALAVAHDVIGPILFTPECKQLYRDFVAWAHTSMRQRLGVNTATFVPMFCTQCLFAPDTRSHLLPIALVPTARTKQPVYDACGHCVTTAKVERSQAAEEKERTFNSVNRKEMQNIAATIQGASGSSSSSSAMRD